MYADLAAARVRINESKKRIFLWARSWLFSVIIFSSREIFEGILEQLRWLHESQEEILRSSRPNRGGAWRRIPFLPSSWVQLWVSQWDIKLNFVRHSVHLEGSSSNSITRDAPNRWKPNIPLVGYHVSTSNFSRRGTTSDVLHCNAHKNEICEKLFKKRLKSSEKFLKRRKTHNAQSLPFYGFIAVVTPLESDFFPQ